MGPCANTVSNEKFHKCQDQYLWIPLGGTRAFARMPDTLLWEARKSVISKFFLSFLAPQFPIVCGPSQYMQHAKLFLGKISYTPPKSQIDPSNVFRPPPKKNGRMDLFVATGGNWICCWGWSYGQDAPRSKGLNLPSQNRRRRIIILLLKAKQKGQNHQEIAHRLYCTI